MSRNSHAHPPDAQAAAGQRPSSLEAYSIVPNGRGTEGSHWAGWGGPPWVDWPLVAWHRTHITDCENKCCVHAFLGVR